MNSQAESPSGRELAGKRPSPSGRLAWPAAAFLTLLGLHFLQPPRAEAAGSGLNILVVANAASSNSLDLANYYCQRRQVPPQNLLRITWNGSRVSWSASEFDAVLLQPVLHTLAERGLSNQVDFVLLSMDLPYRISFPDNQNATTAALFYGLKTNDPATAGEVCRFAEDAINRYYGSETLFREGGPTNSAGRSLLATMITANSLPQARRYVDQGVEADATRPTNRIVLAKTSDVARNVRFRYFDNTVFDLRIHGGPPAEHVLLDAFAGLTGLGGLQTGLAQFTASPEAFIPGALADSLTSSGGQLFEASGQTSLLGFLDAGAAGSYGTIAEPCNYLEKFPDPLAYLYQARGFSLAEAYYQSLIAPYQGIVVGDPLAAPFRRAGTGAWLGLDGLPTLAGITNLALSLKAADPDHPVQRVDLFLDGHWLQTITNLAPPSGNLLHVEVNGHALDYTVPADATLHSIARDLETSLSEASFHDLTGVDVYSYGDRLELQSLPEDRLGSETTLSASSEAGSASELGVFIRPAQPTFVDTIAHGWRAFSLQGTASPGDVLQLTVTKTHAESVTVSVTNSPPANSLAALALRLAQGLNTHPALTGSDGVFARDVTGGGTTDTVELNVFARAEGRDSSRIEVTWSVPEGFTVDPGPVQRLDERPNDLHPRNHLYLTAGATNLTLTFPLDTTGLADGYHELRAVAYEGTAVATQSHFPLAVRIQNSALQSTIQQLGEPGPIHIGTPIQVKVAGGPGTVSRIELQGPGGSLGSTTNESESIFTLDGSTLGAGDHALHAIVQDPAGHTFRTATLVLTLYRHPAFELIWSGPPQQELTWPAEPGFRYQILSADSPDGPWRLRDTLTAPEGGLLVWPDPELQGPEVPNERFYRVRGLP